MAPLVNTSAAAHAPLGIFQKISAGAITFAPAILAGVIAVEQTAGTLPGETKAALVANTAAAGLQAAGQLLPPGHVQEFVGLASLLVSILNASGIGPFKKKVLV